MKSYFKDFGKIISKEKVLWSRFFLIASFLNFKLSEWVKLDFVKLTKLLSQCVNLDINVWCLNKWTFSELVPVDFQLPENPIPPAPLLLSITKILMALSGDPLHWCPNIQILRAVQKNIVFGVTNFWGIFWLYLRNKTSYLSYWVKAGSKPAWTAAIQKLGPRGPPHF